MKKLLCVVLSVVISTMLVGTIVVIANTSLLNLQKPARGSNVGTWDVPINSNFQLIDDWLASWISGNTSDTVTVSKKIAFAPTATNYGATRPAMAFKDNTMIPPYELATPDFVDVFMVNGRIYKRKGNSIAMLNTATGSIRNLSPEEKWGVQTVAMFFPNKTIASNVFDTNFEWAWGEGTVVGDRIADGSNTIFRFTGTFISGTPYSFIGQPGASSIVLSNFITNNVQFTGAASHRGFYRVRFPTTIDGRATYTANTLNPAIYITFHTAISIGVNYNTGAAAQSLVIAKKGGVDRPYVFDSIHGGTCSLLDGEWHDIEIYAYSTDYYIKVDGKTICAPNIESSTGAGLMEIDSTTNLGVQANTTLAIMATAPTNSSTIYMDINQWEELLNVSDNELTSSQTNIANLHADEKWDTKNLANNGFSYVINGITYFKEQSNTYVGTKQDASPTGTVTQNGWGGIALEIGTNKIIDVQAPSSPQNYGSKALAIAALEAIAPSANHVRIGYVYVRKTDGAFTWGTTGITFTNVTSSFYNKGY